MSNEGADRTTCIIRMVTLIVGAVAAVLAIVAVTIYARRALKQALVVRMCVGCSPVSDALRLEGPLRPWFRVFRSPLWSSHPAVSAKQSRGVVCLNIHEVTDVLDYRTSTCSFFAHTFAGG